MLANALHLFVLVLVRPAEVARSCLEDKFVVGYLDARFTCVLARELHGKIINHAWPRRVAFEFGDNHFRRHYNCAYGRTSTYVCERI